MAPGERMSDLEAVMWALEDVDPALRATMTLVAVLDRPVDRDRLFRRLDVVSRRVPRLRDRVVRGPLPMVPPRWEPDPEFDPSRHLRYAVAPGPGTPDHLLAVAEAVLAETPDRSRPPWAMTLVDGMDGGRQSLVANLHHSYTDGLGAMKLALELFDLEPEPAGDPVPPPSPPSERRPPRFGAVWGDLAYEARRTADAARRGAPWAARVLREAVVDPGPRARATLDLVASLADLARQTTGPGSPLMTARSGGARLAALELPLAGLRRAGRRAGATINDVFVSGLLGGLALYHGKHGAAPASLRLGVPVSTRVPGDAGLGNQLEGLVMRGPLRPADALERTRLVHEIVRHARRQPLTGLADPLTAAVLRVPGGPQMVAAAVRSMDLLASNLPGPPVPLYLAGAEVERLVPFGPRSGSALNVTLLSHGQTVRIGVNMDPAALPDHGVVLDCLGAGLDEVLGL